MYFLSEMPDEATQIAEQLKARVAGFLSPLAASGKLFARGADPFGEDSARESIFRIVDGSFSVTRTDYTLAVLDEGDIFGFDRCLTESRYRLTSEFGVGVELIRFDDIFHHLANSAELARSWTSILVDYQSLYQMALLTVAAERTDPFPTVRQFQAGEVIIAQNTSTTEIFTMVEGHATVEVDGCRVGEISTDEIFGALAAFADTPRTATVRATKKCVVLSLPAEQFIGLMKSRPQTAMKLIHDMACALVASNRALISKI